jgi:tight adherence protein B
MILVAALAGAVAWGGVVMAIYGLGRHEAPPRRRRERRPLRLAGWRTEHALVAATAAALGWLVTGWPVAAAVAGVGAWQALVAWRRPHDDAAARAEAVALWAEILRDGLGTAWELETVLRSTAPTAPRLIRADVEELTARLDYASLDEVLDELALRLGDSCGDLVVCALRLAGSSGGRQVREILDSVAVAAYGEGDALRRIEVARARPRSSARLVAGIVVVSIVSSAVLFADWMDAYDTALGQLVLGLVVVWCGGALWWMARMTNVVRPARFRARRQTPAPEVVS